MPNYLQRVAAAAARTTLGARPPVSGPPLLPAIGSATPLGGAALGEEVGDNPAFMPREADGIDTPVPQSVAPAAPVVQEPAITRSGAASPPSPTPHLAREGHISPAPVPPPEPLVAPSRLEARMAAERSPLASAAESALPRSVPPLPVESGEVTPRIPLVEPTVPPLATPPVALTTTTREQPSPPAQPEWMPSIPKVLRTSETKPASAPPESPASRNVPVTSAGAPQVRAEAAARIQYEPARERALRDHDVPVSQPLPYAPRAAEPVVPPAIGLSAAYPQTKIHIGEVQVLLNTAPSPPAPQPVPRTSATMADSPASAALNRFRLRL